MPVAYNTQQKTAIAEYQQVTQADKHSAARALKQHNWNVGAAANAFFTQSNNGALDPMRNTLNKLFDKYRDDPKNEPDEINAEGVSKLLGDMGIGLEDIGALVFSELVKSPTLGKLTREGFLDGCRDSNVDSVPKLRNLVLQRRAQLGNDHDLFKSVYNHTFALALQPNQKALPQEIAGEFWRVLLSDNGGGVVWRTSATPWLEWWLDFQENHWKKAVNKDLWRQTLAFAEQTMRDDSLAFWNEESSWPSVIDDFVEWVKTQKRSGPVDDAMDVE